jgi:IgA-specific serine endopeptidase
MAKAIKPKDNNEVIELEAEEIPLDKQIDNTLQKHNVTASVIAGLKEKYGGMKLAALDDKESFLEIKQARKEVRQWGILCERITKKGREDAVAIQRKWLEKEKSVLAQIAEVQDPLDAEIKKYEDEVQRKETEAANRREEAYIKRQSQLLKMGASYENGSFNLNQVGYDMTTIKDSDEEIWAETILPKYQREYEKNEAARVTEEKRREEAAEALRQQQLEMDRQRQEFEAQQAEFKKQQEELQRQKDDAARIQRESEEADRRRKREQEAQLINSRVTQLKGVTWNGVTPSFHYNHQIVTTQDIVLAMTEDEFISFRDTHNTKVEKDIADAEEKRQEEIKQREKIAAENAARAERERIEAEQRQAEAQRQEGVRRQQEEALKASDKQKWQSFIGGIGGVVIPDMKSPTYKAKIEEARKLFAKIINL